MLIRVFMSIEERDHARRAAMKPCAVRKWFCGQSRVMQSMHCG